MPARTSAFQTQVIARINIEEKNKLDEISKKRGLSRSSLIRMVLREYLDRLQLSEGERNPTRAA